ncbi:hypothetical protein F0T03_11960 [Yersinia canariae]|uniref:Uncharacterized protein n=1 Tax=Yersinia canariae TaxID=2607663 RepID=A0A857EZF8_9GAMM|nr:hypothetical protein F0T03_11960 [Yersinia canariae]
MYVGCIRSPQSLTCVSSRGFTQLPPSHNSNYLGIVCSSHIRNEYPAIMPNSGSLQFAAAK